MQVEVHHYMQDCQIAGNPLSSDYHPSAAKQLEEPQGNLVKFGQII